MGAEVSNRPSQPCLIPDTLTRKSSPYHSLHSARKAKNLDREYILRKWIFTHHNEAELKLKQLQKRTKEYQDYLTAIKDVEMSYNGKQYEVIAKVEFSDFNLNTQILERRKYQGIYNEQEIWKITQRLCQIFIYLANKKLEYPMGSSGFLYINKKLKAKDFSLFPGQKFDIFAHAEGTIARIMTNLALLSTSQQQVSLFEINEVSSKYNTNLGAFISAVKQKRTSLDELSKICKNVGQKDRMVMGERKESQKQRKGNVLCDKMLTNRKISFISKSLMNDELTINTTKNSSIMNNRESLESVLKNSNLKRLQQITPKQQNHLLHVLQERNKENCYERSNTLHVEDHYFPKKVHNFIRTSFSSKDVQANLRQSQIRSDAFIKMTGGEKLELFAQDSNQSLLKSIEQSQESVIVRNSESPTLNLDQEIESMAHDFLKSREAINDPPHDEVSSIIQLAHIGNSTIIELTEQNEESGQNSKQKNNGILHRNKSVSNFQQSLEQKFIVQMYEGGSRYEGQSVDGLRHGYGKLFYEDGGSYEGNWKLGQIDGYGKLFYQSGDLAYEGNWLNGQFHGEGKIFNEEPDIIEGNFDYTDFGDVGTSWIWYQGNFQNDNKHGNGTILLSNGQIFTGIWNENSVSGEGTFTTKTEQQIHGIWKGNILVQKLNFRDVLKQLLIN